MEQKATLPANCTCIGQQLEISGFKIEHKAGCPAVAPAVPQPADEPLTTDEREREIVERIAAIEKDRGGER